MNKPKVNLEEIKVKRARANIQKLRVEDGPRLTRKYPDGQEVIMEPITWNICEVYEDDPQIATVGPHGSKDVAEYLICLHNSSNDMINELQDLREYVSTLESELEKVLKNE